MPNRLTHRIKRVALKAARPAQRRIVHALRHHAARTRQLAQQRQVSSIDGIRAWFEAFFSMLRVRAGVRRFSLRTLLPTPPKALRALTTRSSTPAAPRRTGSRRPRRLAASTGWFAFAAR